MTSSPSRDDQPGACQQPIEQTRGRQRFCSAACWSGPTAAANHTPTSFSRRSRRDRHAQLASTSASSATPATSGSNAASTATSSAPASGLAAAAPLPGSRHPRRTTTCLTSFKPTATTWCPRKRVNSRQRFCFGNCRKPAWSRTLQSPRPAAPVPPPKQFRSASIHLCPSCENRHLGLQWCPTATSPAPASASVAPARTATNPGTHHQRPARHAPTNPTNHPRGLPSATPREEIFDKRPWKRSLDGITSPGPCRGTGTPGRPWSRRAGRWSTRSFSTTATTPAELLLLNKIKVLRSLVTNYFPPQQTSISKVRGGAKVTNTYDLPTTPHRRAQAHQAVTEQDKTIMKDTLDEVNRAGGQRQIQALTSELLTLTTGKAAARSKPQIQPTTTRASASGSTKRARRSS